MLAGRLCRYPDLYNPVGLKLTKKLGPLTIYMIPLKGYMTDITEITGQDDSFILEQDNTPPIQHGGGTKLVDGVFARSPCFALLTVWPIAKETLVGREDEDG